MKQLNEMSLEELWRLFPIILSPPNPQWTVLAAHEIESLRKLLGDNISEIHHIGSTAISGIWAKPIIDLLIETDAIENLQPIKNRLVAAGYICMNEDATRLDFNKGYTIEGFAERVYHIHVRLAGDNDEIFFRDYLNSHPEVAKKYEELKLSLWQQFEHDRDGYTRAKTDFVAHYTHIAKHHR